MPLSAPIPLHERQDRHIAAQGVDIAIRQAICGHESKQINLHYTHADLATIRTATTQLAAIWASKA